MSGNCHRVTDITGLQETLTPIKEYWFLGLWVVRRVRSRVCPCPGGTGPALCYKRLDP